MDTQLTLWNLLPLLVLLFALYFFFLRRSNMAEKSSKSIYDFTVKVRFLPPFCVFLNFDFKLFYDYTQLWFSVFFILIDWKYCILVVPNCCCTRISSWVNEIFKLGEFSNLRKLILIWVIIAGYPWKWCEFEWIQWEGSTGCQCCFTMVTLFHSFILNVALYSLSIKCNPRCYVVWFAVKRVYLFVCLMLDKCHGCVL